MYSLNENFERNPIDLELYINFEAESALWLDFEGYFFSSSPSGGGDAVASYAIWCGGQLIIWTGGDSPLSFNLLWNRPGRALHLIFYGSFIQDGRIYYKSSEEGDAISKKDDDESPPSEGDDIFSSYFRGTGCDKIKTWFTFCIIFSFGVFWEKKTAISFGVFWEIKCVSEFSEKL